MVKEELRSTKMRTLAEGAIFNIVADGPVATCKVVNRTDVTPEEGARCSREMRDVLVDRVLARGSAYAGFVFDVTNGPHVFGPRTRASLEELFRTAEAQSKRVAVRVGPHAVQQLQFKSLCRECAPTQGRVFEDDSANDWAAARI
jgi:hypothetical protein